MANLPELTPVEQRVLGALMEKQRTVPDSYPLSLNALRVACNQSTSRDPVVDYDEQTLNDAARGLKDRELLRFVWAGKGSRVMKLHQRLDEQLGLEPDEAALLTVLLLRGPQTAGELRTRTERLHHFADKAEVEVCLARLAEAEPALVRELTRQAGQHDPRWVHLLGPLPSLDAAVLAEPAADLEGVLADGPEARDARVRRSYDAVAEVYAEAGADALQGRHFDLWLLERIAEAAAGPVADVGCGAGHIAAFLADAGATVRGIDISGQMVAQARERYPGLEFETGDLRRLLRPRDAEGWATILVWDALGHFAPSELDEVFASLARTLAPGGTLVVAAPVGETLAAPADVLGVPVELTWVRHGANTIRQSLARTGLGVTEWYVRGALNGEESVDRLYVVAMAER